MPATYEDRPPDGLDSGRNCTAANLGSLAEAGFTEIRFAGGTWDFGGNRAVALVVFTAPGLTAEAIAEFYGDSARAANRTKVTGESTPTLAGRGRPRLRHFEDGERIQTVVVGPGPSRHRQRGHHQRPARPEDRGGGPPPSTAADRRSGAQLAAMSAEDPSRVPLGASVSSPARGRAPERKARFSTISDMPIDGLYGPWSSPADADARIGLPGEPPFTRGIHPTGYRSRLWTMRMFAGFGAAEDTNARFHQLLAAGQTGLSIAYDMPTLMTATTPTIPRPRASSGRAASRSPASPTWRSCWPGCRSRGLQHLDDDQLPAAPIWAMYIAAAEKGRRPARPAEGTIQNDILKEFIAQKEFLFPPAPSMRLVTDTIEFGTRELPRWNTISISGYHIREAGSDRGPGAGVHHRRWDGLRAAGARARPARRRLRAAPVVLLQQPQRLLRGDRQVPSARRIWHDLMTTRYGAENERSVADALPHPDRGREPDRTTT